MGIKKSDAEFTEPFVGTTEVIVMMSVQGGRSTSSAVRLDYNAVHALEKAIVDYTFLDDTPQTEVGYCNECRWFKDKQVCGRCRSRNLFAKADTPQMDVYDYKGNGKWERSE